MTLFAAKAFGGEECSGPGAGGDEVKCPPLGRNIPLRLQLSRRRDLAAKVAGKSVALVILWLRWLLTTVQNKVLACNHPAQNTLEAMPLPATLAGKLRL